MKSAPPNTALQWLDYGEAWLQSASLFFGHGKNNAKDEAAALIAHALCITHEHSEYDLQQPLSAVQQQYLHDVFKQRIEQRLPTPYITHEMHFAGFPFYVDERVIIPRSPMAELIMAQFSPYMDEPKNITLLDLCCGSGCLGIASCLHADFIDELYLCDISKEALQVAEINVRKYELSNHIHLLQGDLFSPLRQLDHTPKFDIILCNPPYVDVIAMHCLPKEYQHEPALALDGRKRINSHQQDGLEIVDEIIRECGIFLSDGGWLFLEVGASKEAFEKKYQHLYPIEVPLEAEAQGVYAIPSYAF